VLQLVCTLQVMVDQIRQLEAEIAQALRAHPDGEIFQSFFRNPESVICAATLLGEIGDSRHRYSHRDAIAADAGQAPVAVESGKHKEREVPMGMQQTAPQSVRGPGAEQHPIKRLGG
jgi:transposase